MSGLFMAFIGAALIQNVVLTQFLGADSCFGASGQVKVSMMMGGVMVAVTTLVSALASLLYDFVLTPLGLEFLKTAVFILAAAVLVWGFRQAMKARFPGADKTLTPLYPLMVANSAALGVALTNIQNGYDFGECVLSGFGAGLGYAVVIFLLACIRAQMREEDVPESLRGAPIVLIAAALMSIAFMGFANLS